MISAALLLAAQVPQIIGPGRDRPAAPWTERFSGRCGNDVLEVVRPMRPLDARPRIMINGARVRGDTHQIEQELDAVGAAYRFQMLCSPDRKIISLLWFRGLFDGRGVGYRAGSARFRGGKLVGSTFEDANERGFWYR